MLSLQTAIEEDIPALINQQNGLRSSYAEQGRFSPLLEANVAFFAEWYAKKLLYSDDLNFIKN